MEKELKEHFVVIGLVTVFGTTIFSGIGIHMSNQEKQRNEQNSLNSDLKLCKKQLEGFSEIKGITSELVP